ncbi:MAG: hypothetical protein R3244_09270 [Thermoanaerobaculia bacterium]|nr:hypothetical protein [Thermoanaerobaculia bacterium]
MKRIAVLVPVLVVALAAIAATASADVEIRRIAEQFELSAEHEILLDVPLGEVRVVAGEPGRVEVEIVVLCGSSSERCRERAEEVRLDHRLRKHSLALDLRGYSNKLLNRPSVEVLLTMPAANALEVELGVGEIQIEDLAGDLEVELGVGEVDVFASEAVVGTVRLSVGVGEANLYPRRRSQSDSGFLFLGNEVVWDEGPGTAYLVVDVGVGEVNVTLE